MLTLFAVFCALVVFRFIICWAKDANPQPIRVEDQRDIGRKLRNKTH